MTGTLYQTSYRITRMRWWHLEEILRVEEELFGAERWSVGMFWNELAAGNYYRVSTAADGRIAGYAGLTTSTPGEAWVQNIAVRRDLHGRGIGRALLADLLGEAARQRAPKVFLEVAVDNERAQRLYAWNGFEAVGIRRGYYQPSNTDALVMLREERQ